jgi:hypothetical protein
VGIGDGGEEGGILRQKIRRSQQAGIIQIKKTNYHHEKYYD